MKRSFFGLTLILTLSGLLPGQVGEASAEEYLTAFVTWQAPLTGSPAVRYLVRIRDLDGTLNETYTVEAAPGLQQSFTFTRVEYARRYQGRVAAIDALGRQGPWSNWSPVYDRESSVPQP
jgi:hypothetical protein